MIGPAEGQSSSNEDDVATNPSRPAVEHEETLARASNSASGHQRTSR